MKLMSEETVTSFFYTVIDRRQLNWENVFDCIPKYYTCGVEGRVPTYCTPAPSFPVSLMTHNKKLLKRPQFWKTDGKIRTARAHGISQSHIQGFRIPDRWDASEKNINKVLDPILVLYNPPFVTI